MHQGSGPGLLARRGVGRGFWLMGGADHGEGNTNSLSPLPLPCPPLPACSVFCYRDWHTFSGTLHFSGLQQAPQLTFHSPRLFTLHQLLRRPRIQLDSQLLDRFLYLAYTPWLVQGILAAEKQSRLGLRFNSHFITPPFFLLKKHLSWSFPLKGSKINLVRPHGDFKLEREENLLVCYE